MNSPDRRQFLRTTAGGMAASMLLPDLALLRPSIAGGAPLVVALIGAGRQGRLILTELATTPEVEVRAVCDSDDSRLQAALRRSPNFKGYATHKELLDKEHDVAAVIVATPTHLHTGVVLDCLSAGKHVYCEAPLATTPEDCKAIALAARASGKTFASGFQARANPVYGLARSFARSGSLRDTLMLRGAYGKKTTWRTPGSTPERDKELNWHLDPALSLGLLGEIGSHQFDVFHWFTGRFPVAARARGDIRFHKDGRTMADTVACELRFEDGLRLDYTATLGSSFEGRNELLVGSNASIKLAWTHGWMFKEADSATQGWEVYANRQEFHSDQGITQGITLIADATKLAAQGKLTEGVGLPFTSLYYALLDFVKAASEGKPVACSADEGARTTLVSILAQRALTGGAEVAIEPKALEEL
jgi:predicted dehydrogenase